MSFIKKYKMQIIYTVITLLAGGLSALLSGSFDIYSTMKQPPLAPPCDSVSDNVDRSLYTYGYFRRYCCRLARS